jgi:thiamine transport system permease protein
MERQPAAAAGAYALLAYPFVANALGAALDSLPPSLLQVARTLGASPAAGVLARDAAAGAAGAAPRHGICRGDGAGRICRHPVPVAAGMGTLTTLIYERLGRPGAANRDEALVLAALLMLLACWCSC